MKMSILTIPSLRKTLMALLLAGFALGVSAADKTLPDGLYAQMDTTKGKIVLQLEYEKVPLTVANFVGLAEGTKNYSTDGSPPKKQDKPFYDGLTFHRVIPDFMIQGGDPAGTGGGGPGYSFKDETRADLKHDKAGILSMANSDRPGSKKPYSNGGSSNGSQFFITHKDTPWLDGMHSVFGHVVEGQDVVNAIVMGDKIKTLKILRVGDKAKAFKGDEAQFEKLSKQR
jgi:peptidyl-prolyl cis-trans isomerase A (cyclophilin A)